MRKQLQMKTRFEPTRLSGDQLRHAYEIVVPVVERILSAEDGEVRQDEDDTEAWSSTAVNDKRSQPAG